MIARKAQSAASAWLHRGSLLHEPRFLSFHHGLGQGANATRNPNADLALKTTSHHRRRRPQHGRSLVMALSARVAKSKMQAELAQKSRSNSNPLVWIDCEMTGLNLESDEILEVFCLLTTGDLDIIDDEGFHAVIHCPQSRLDRMDEWCTKTHGGTGLTAACAASTTTAAQAADALYEYITKFVPTPRVALLAGNSVHVDKAFLKRGPFARVIEHLHYRILDVSSIKEAASRWSPPSVLERAPKKEGTHKARDDILESINEARFYRNAIFRTHQAVGL